MNNLPLSIDLFATPETTCNYLPDQQSTTVFADPNLTKDKNVHSILALQGFRRSGEYIYRPNCQACQACISTRLRVADFQLNRNQRRTWKRNQDLDIQIHPAKFEQEHFDLYQRYIATRHEDGGMDNPTPESYMQFLTCEWSDTYFIEFRLDQNLVAVAVLDALENAFSAVYTFFAPHLSQRSLGRFAVLYEIDFAKQKGIEYLYLGYWIKECQKMSYKLDYQPQEHFIRGRWQNAIKK